MANLNHVIYLSHFNNNISKAKVHLTLHQIDDPINPYDYYSYKKMDEYEIKPAPICNASLAWYVKPKNMNNKTIKEKNMCVKCLKKYQHYDD